MRNKPDETLVTLRRSNLKRWIADHCGKQADFIAKTEINQGELSGLLSGKKSFGEKKARNLEEDAGMPPLYLDKNHGESHPAVAIDEHRKNRLVQQLCDIAETINDIGLKKLLPIVKDYAAMHPVRKPRQKRAKAA